MTYPQSNYLNNFYSIIFMTLSHAGFAICDITIKLISEQIPIGETMFIHGLLAMIFCILAIWWTGEQSNLKQLKNIFVIIRIILEAIIAILIFYGLKLLPISDLTAIMSSVPIVIMVIVSLFLKQKVTQGQWIATLIGFIGVLFVAKLTNLAAPILIAIFIAIFIGFRDVLTKYIPHTISMFTITMSSLCVTIPCGLIIGIPEEWIMPNFMTMIYLLMSALSVYLAYLANIYALRNGDLHITAPFRYTRIIYGLIAGYLIWNEQPDTLSILGCLMITIAGIYIINSQRKATKNTI